ENTRVILPPMQRLATFGTSLINYYLVTEDMDAALLTRVREGQIHAERPEIISSSYFAKLILNRFGTEGQKYADFLINQPDQPTFLKYGFRLRKSEIRSFDIHRCIEEVTHEITETVAAKNDPLTAVLTGIDDAWEICLLKFMVDLVQRSAGKNFSDS